MIFRRNKIIFGCIRPTITGLKITLKTTSDELTFQEGMRSHLDSNFVSRCTASRGYKIQYLKCSTFQIFRSFTMRSTCPLLALIVHSFALCVRRALAFTFNKAFRVRSPCLSLFLKAFAFHFALACALGSWSAFAHRSPFTYRFHIVSQIPFCIHTPFTLRAFSVRIPFVSVRSPFKWESRTLY